MLILSRKKNESIIIGDNIEIMVTDVRGENVKLGVNAPRHISVHRKEIYDSIKSENISATETNTSHLATLSELLRKRKPQRTRYSHRFSEGTD